MVHPMTATDPVGETVAERLRADILSGALSPGVPLREVAIAERFDVSRNTVREAIRLLTGEGLLFHARHRGAEVRSHSEDDVIDVYRARILVEMAAAEHVVMVGSFDTQPFQDAIVALERAVRTGDWAAGTHADLGFHHALVAAAGSARLTTFHLSLQNELRLLLLFADRDSPEPDKVASHRELFALLRTGDLPAVREELRGHTAQSETNLRALVARRDETLADHLP
jgi:DNA-binding GntR family transcriptional regulator